MLDLELQRVHLNLKKKTIINHKKNIKIMIVESHNKVILNKRIKILFMKVLTIAQQKNIIIKMIKPRKLVK